MSEHVGEAESRLELIEDQWADGRPDDNFIRTLAVEAQVHATLALVEQQRIANLIAYFSVDVIGGGAGSAGALEDIERGLGLT